MLVLAFDISGRIHKKLICSFSRIRNWRLKDRGGEDSCFVHILTYLKNLSPPPSIAALWCSERSADPSNFFCLLLKWSSLILMLTSSKDYVPSYLMRYAIRPFRKYKTLGFPSGLAVKNLLAMQEMQVWSLDCEDPLEKGNNNPLKYSYLGNAMDRGAWWASPLSCKRVRRG